MSPGNRGFVLETGNGYSTYKPYFRANESGWYAIEWNGR